MVERNVWVWLAVQGKRLILYEGRKEREKALERLKVRKASK